MVNVIVHKHPIFLYDQAGLQGQIIFIPRHLPEQICDTAKHLQDGGFRKSVALGEWLRMDNGPA